MQARGGYPPPNGASSILGLECAGEIADANGNHQFVEGQQVCALLAGGGYAERVAVPVEQVLPIPDGLSLTKVAGIPEVFATAYLNLFIEASAIEGETALIHAGASGVGLAAIQLCRLKRLTCWATGGGMDKSRECIRLGASGFTDRRTGDFAMDVRKWTAEKGVDVILDPVGPSYLARNLDSLAYKGRLILIGMLGASEREDDLSIERVLGELMSKRLRLAGSTLRARSPSEKGEILRALQTDTWQEFADGTLEVPIDSTFPISEAQSAHERIASNKTIGKVILTRPD